MQISGKVGRRTGGGRPTRPVSLPDVITVDCIEWQGSQTTLGYGLTYTGSYLDGSRKSHYVHRVIWERLNGTIPEGMNVCHRCDNPSCYNPKHLFLGTQADNIRDMRLKGRHYTKLQPDDVVEIRSALASGIGLTELSKRFGVTKQCVSHIRTGRTWG